MKKTIYFSVSAVVILFVSIIGFAAIQPDHDSPIDPLPMNDKSKIQWYSMEEALALSQQSPKKLFIDIYTDWCGWCKVMDRKTFTDADVIEYLNENFYPVKFNAEQQGSITFKNQSYKYVKAGRRGIHELAYLLLDRQASYPSFVVLDENLDRLGIMKGFKASQPFLQELGHYVAAESKKSKSK